MRQLYRYVPILRGVLPLVLLALLATPVARAGETPEKMRVIALMDSAPHQWQFDIHDPIHTFLEMPLNYLGIVVERHDIRHGPPPEEWLENARAIVTLFDYTDKPCDWLWPWLEEQAKRPGMRFVHTEDFGPLIAGKDGKADYTRLSKWLARFGLGCDDYYRDEPLGVKTTLSDLALCAYEADPRFLATHSGPWNESDRNRVWVTTELVRKGTGRKRHPVVTGAWGGVALAPWTLRRGSELGDRRWHLDPFEFFRVALGLDRVPAAHPAVLNGRRMFFCHVDGDGFESISTVEHGAYAAKCFLDRIIDEFPLPFTISVIIGSLTNDIAVKEETDRMDLARKIFTRKNVEPASHAVLHPFFWQVEKAPSYARRMAAYKPLLNYEATPGNEVRDSFRFISERLLEEGRYCRVMLWSGDTTPTGATVAEVAKLGSWNLNGGTYRWDGVHDSVGYVSPWARRVAGAVQVYAGAGNENEYEGFWDRLPTAYKHVDVTITRTGTGRIIKPANVYLHFYSAERPGRLKSALQLIRKWGLEERTSPVFASEYCKAVYAASTTARLFRNDDGGGGGGGGGWRFSGFGLCRTLRIDGETRSVDFAKSTGLLGALHRDDDDHGALFLHLSGPDGTVVLADGDPAPRPHVAEANHVLYDADLREKSVAVSSEALFPRLIIFAGLPREAAVDLIVDGETRNAATDAHGRLVYRATRPGRIRVEVRVR